jgi:hypothetical protein
MKKDGNTVGQVKCRREDEIKSYSGWLLNQVKNDKSIRSIDDGRTIAYLVYLVTTFVYQTDLPIFNLPNQRSGNITELRINPWSGCRAKTGNSEDGMIIKDDYIRHIREVASPDQSPI